MDKSFNKNFIKFLMTLVVFIDFMGVAIVVVLFPNIFLDNESMLFSSIGSHADRLVALGACLAIYPLGQFFGSSVFGKLSDYYGRKIILAWTLIGTMSGFMLSAIADTRKLVFVVIFKPIINRIMCRKCRSCSSKLGRHLD